MKRDLNAGDRVFMRVRPTNAGAVCRVNASGFSVVFDDPGRKPYEPRSRYRYPWQKAGAFIKGNPPSDQE